jgi:hypothetical protein
MRDCACYADKCEEVGGVVFHLDETNGTCILCQRLLCGRIGIGLSLKGRIEKRRWVHSTANEWSLKQEREWLKRRWDQMSISLN